ncbi:MAG TPA: double-strand break repair helicase AddA [Rhizomicrobium sp.]|nr:double-strand break repair helicase AddA [Rhizomicrobium sp.]
MSEPSTIAADPRHSAWVAANAGSGKTFTLANRVTRLLLAEVKPEKILCLTYTKAAAAEMQGRLFKQLGEWSMLPDDALKANIAKIGAEPGGAQQLRKARRLFAQALETPGGLKIQTIHAFCQSLLTRFPIEAGIAPSFDVLDDQTARELMAASRNRVLERAGSGDAARATALAFLLTQTSETTMSALLDAALAGDRRKLERFLDDIAANNESIGAAVRRAHGARAEHSADDIATDHCAALQRDVAELKDVVAWLAGGTDATAKLAAQIASVIGSAPSADAYYAYRAALLTQKGEPRKKLATKGLADARPDLAALLERLQSDLLACEQQRKAAHAAMLAEAALVVVDAVRGEYQIAKRARGVLDYEDLITTTRNLLERSDAAAWVLYKLDGGIDHILIDEAQDTSPEQWRIVKALTQEFFAGEGGDADKGRERTIFAVGDEKQSIFSFQGADPAEFARHRDEFQAAAKAAGRDFIAQPLLQSRRSVPEVLQFVDEVFKPEAARQGLTSDNEPLHHDAYRAKDKGRVELWDTTKPEDSEDEDPWTAPVNVLSKQSPAAKLAREIAKKIKNWIGHMVLPGHTEAVKAGDIMILLPKREPFGTAVIRELKQLDVPVAGADRVTLTEQIGVMDLMALGRFVLLPEDNYNLAALLRSPLCSVSEEELFKLSYGREGSLWRELQRRHDETPSFTEAHDFLSAMRSRADFVPPFEFYAHVLGTLGHKKRLLKRLGQEASDAIEEFLSLALAFETDNTPSLEGFLHWIERGETQIKRDMERGRDEVRVMTVHGAKGLEADIVILADTTRAGAAKADHGNLLYTDDGVLYPVTNDEAPRAVLAAKQVVKERMLEEHRRLLYVALTRARDRLVVCGFEGKKGVRPDSWYTLAKAAAEKLGKAILREDGETVRVIGETDAQLAQPTEAASEIAIAIPSWANQSPPIERANPRLIRPSDASDVEEPAPSSPHNTQRFRRGLLVHALLARLPEIEPEQRRGIALKFLKAQRDVENIEAIADETIRVLNDPQFAAAFAPGSRAEAGLVADLPELGEGARINGRVDRLKVRHDEVLIVDFKTNRPPPAREEDVAQIYRTQMALYRAGATKIFPGRRIACALVWTEGPRLMPLSDSLLDAELARISARLQAR